MDAVLNQIKRGVKTALVPTAVPGRCWAAVLGGGGGGGGGGGTGRWWKVSLALVR